MGAGSHSSVQAVRPRRFSERSRARSKSREPASQQSPSRRRDPLATITNKSMGAPAASTSPGKYEASGGEFANADTGYDDGQETVWGGASRHEGSILRFPLQLRGRDEDEAARRKRARGGDDENLVVPLRCARKLLSSSFLATFSVLMAYMNRWLPLFLLLLHPSLLLPHLPAPSPAFSPLWGSARSGNSRNARLLFTPHSSPVDKCTRERYARSPKTSTRCRAIRLRRTGNIRAGVLDPLLVIPNIWPPPQHRHFLRLFLGQLPGVEQFCASLSLRVSPSSQFSASINSTYTP